jgi:hypothetical protein
MPVQHHDVKLQLNGGTVSPTPDSFTDLTQGLNIYDTVSFSGANGEQIRITIVDFNTGTAATPFSEPDSPIIDSTKVFHVTKPGLYCFQCALKPSNSKAFIGWPNADPAQQRPTGTGANLSGVEVPVPRTGG